MSKLDREQIIVAALSVMRADGEAALTMRALASRLGVTPMALYHHFADRDALLLALVARVSAEIVFPVPADDPRDRAVDLALCLHDLLVEHHWMIRLISAGRLTSPAGLRFPEGFLTCAQEAGLGAEAAFVFYRTMFATVLGQATIAHVKNGAPGVLPPGADQLSLPAVTGAAPHWNDWDARATPARVFRAVVGILPAI